MKRSSTLCLCGHRPGRLPKNDKLDLLEREIFAAVDNAIDEGYETFLFGGCYGFELVAARQVLLRKKLQKGDKQNRIKLIAVIPFEEQANDWKEKNRREYFEILSQCDDCITLCDRYDSDCWLDRNKFMVNHSSKMICYYSGGKGITGYTFFYATAKGIGIDNLYVKETASA